MEKPIFQTEATYDVVMSAWNPIDGWVSSKPSKMEILARVGPITIDDYLIVSDNVRKVVLHVICIRA